MKELKNLSKIIKNLRINSGMTQSEVARKIGVTSVCINKIENNINSPSLSVLYKLSQLFNLSIEKLLGQEINIVDGFYSTFYSKFGDIDSLNKEDQNLIKKIIQRLKNA